MIVPALLFILAVVAGVSLVRVLAGADLPGGWLGWLIQIALGSALGLALAGTLFFALLWVRLSGPIPILVALALCGTALAFLAFRTGRARVPADSRASATVWGLRCATALALALFLGSVWQSIDANPNGGWDAFSIWNLKAKYLAAGTASWRNAMAPFAGGQLFGANHPGYPLLPRPSLRVFGPLPAASNRPSPPSSRPVSGSPAPYCCAAPSHGFEARWPAFWPR